MHLLDQFRKWANGLQRQSSSTKALVHCDDGGVTQIIEQNGGASRVDLSWQDVSAIYAFKRDCFAVDQICLAIGDAASGRWIEVREDDIGYQDLIDQLPVYVPGFPSSQEWFETVALPAFETNWTQIYRRPE